MTPGIRVAPLPSWQGATNYAGSGCRREERQVDEAEVGEGLHIHGFIGGHL